MRSLTIRWLPFVPSLIFDTGHSLPTKLPGNFSLWRILLINPIFHQYSANIQPIYNQYSTNIQPSSQATSLYEECSYLIRYSTTWIILEDLPFILCGKSGILGHQHFKNRKYPTPNPPFFLMQASLHRVIFKSLTWEVIDRCGKENPKSGGKDLKMMRLCKPNISASLFNSIYWTFSHLAQ